MPGLSCATKSKNKFQALCSSSSSEEVVSSALLTHDAQAKEQYEPKASDAESAEAHHSSLVADDRADPHFCSVRFGALATAAVGLFS